MPFRARVATSPRGTDTDGDDDELLELHLDVVHATRSGARLDRAVGRTLRRLRELDGVAALGFVRVGDYVRERLGQSPRWAEECVRLDRSCRAHPELGAAHASGRLTTSHVLAIAGVIDAHTVRAWIARAETHTVRELRSLVAASRRNATAAPAAGTDAGAERHVRIEVPVPAAVGALFDHAVDVARRLLGYQAPVHTCVEQMLAEYVAGHHISRGTLAREAEADRTDALARALAQSTSGYGAAAHDAARRGDRSAGPRSPLRVPAWRAPLPERLIDARPPPIPSRSTHTSWHSWTSAARATRVSPCSSSASRPVAAGGTWASPRSTSTAGRRWEYRFAWATSCVSSGGSSGAVPRWRPPTAPARSRGRSSASSSPFARRRTNARGSRAPGA